MNTSPEYIMLINAIYPVGHIFKCTDPNMNPESFLPEGSWTWQKIEGTFLYNSKDEITSSTRTGGSATAQLTEVPVHSHTGDLYNRTHYGQNANKEFYQASPSTTSTLIQTTAYGSSSAIPTHNNMPPYRAVYMWRRVT